MNVILRLQLEVENCEGKKIYLLIKKIEDAKIIPHKGDYILDEICDKDLSVNEVLINYGKNITYVFLKLFINGDFDFDKIKPMQDFNTITKNEWYFAN